MTISYDGNLELFFEKRVASRWVLRFAANNLLDAEKLEDIALYDGDSGAEFANAIRTGAIDGYAAQLEDSSPISNVTLRAAF